MTTFHHLLRSAAEKHGGRDALMFDDQRLSYETLLARAEALAGGLAQQGIGPDDHVAVVMDNSVECVLAWLACSLIGCTEIPINPHYRGELLIYLLVDCAATTVICDSEYVGNLSEIAGRLPSLRLVLVNGESSADLGPLRVDELQSCSAPRFVPIADAPERVILYTSGTTGPSKGVVHSQKSSLQLAQYNASILGYGPEDRLLNFFPLFHQNARYTGVIPALASGASIRIERRLSTSTFWETCDRDGITAFNYLGSVLRMILNVTPAARRAGSHSIRRAFGAGASADVWKEFEERLGIALIETYGLSEAPMATINVPGSGRSPFGSAGRASDLFEVSVVDEQDVPVAPGEVGEIVLRPRRPDALMIGYHNKDAATVEAFRNLWFHSGDRGWLSPDGDLYFEERQKDSIRRRGENISAWEVESVLERHPGVLEAAVYGLPADDREEEVAASIIASAEALDLDDLYHFARAHLPGYAVPTLVRIVTDLPRTPTAKVKKDVLRQIKRDEHLPMSRETAPTTARAE